MLIGITGMSGSGKGTVVEYLKEKGFEYYSVSGFIGEEVERRGLMVDRDSLIAMGNELRSLYGADYILLQLIEKTKGRDAIIESVRTVGEVKTLKKNGGVLWAVTADQKLRYERVKLRGSNKDNVSFEKFCEQEKGELESDDMNKQNLKKCLEMADVVINNDGNIGELIILIEEKING